MSTAELKRLAADSDERAELIPDYGLEALLEQDSRFVSSGGLWGLAPDAPVPGAALTGVEPNFPAEIQDGPEVIREFIVLDVETTGTDLSSSHLIEVSALQVRDWEVIDQFDALVFAEDVSPAIEALTGISTSAVRVAPSADQVVSAFVRFAGTLPVMGHNVQFDVSMIRSVDSSYAPSMIFDTLDIAHVAYPTASSRSLEALGHECGLLLTTSHRALADCRTALAVARSMVAKIDQDIAPFDVIRSVLRQARHPWTHLLANTPSTPASLDWVQRMNPPWLSETMTSLPHAPAAEEVFAPTGMIMQRAPGAETRPTQFEMAVESQRALREDLRLLIEAPTGTGKTFAYLVPGISHGGRTNRPVWVSTHTKALQTQLQQDFEHLVNLGVISGNLAVLKGRENYLCTRDLLAASEVDLSPEAAIEITMLLNLLALSQEGEIGEATDFWLTRNRPQAAEIRNTVRLNPTTCERRQCEFVEVCPYFAARDRAERSSLVAVNHALLVTELGDATDVDSPRPAGLVIDEAHTLEDAATSMLTVDFDPRAITGWLNRLVDPDVSTGLLRNVGRGFGLRAVENPSYGAALEVVRRARKAVRVFAERMALYLSEFVGQPQEGAYPITHRFRLGVDDRRFLFLESRQALFTFGELARELVETLRRLRSDTENRSASEGHNAKALRRRLLTEATRGNELIEQALTLLTLTDDNQVVYATWERSEGELPALIVTKAPVDVSPVLRKLYDCSPSVIATSATLTVGGSFDFMRERLAADDFVGISLPNVFDYSRQAALLLTRHLPAPRADREAEFVEAVADVGDQRIARFVIIGLRGGVGSS